MPTHYSIYEAKAKLSEIIRRVRELKETAIISYHGKPVAEIRPIEPRTPETLEERISRLEAQGVLIPARSPGAKLEVGEHVPGALQRFLEDR